MPKVCLLQRGELGTSVTKPELSRRWYPDGKNRIQILRRCFFDQLSNVCRECTDDSFVGRSLGFYSWDLLFCMCISKLRGNDHLRVRKIGTTTNIMRGGGDQDLWYGAWGPRRRDCVMLEGKDQIYEGAGAYDKNSVEISRSNWRRKSRRWALTASS